MKQNSTFLLIIILAFSFCCSKEPEAVNEQNIKKGFPKQNEYDNNYPNALREPVINFNTTGAPEILINSNEELLDTININLDLDGDEEQILILKILDDINTPIKIAVIDFDPVREKMIRSWEYLTNSTNQRAYNLEFEDIIGDYNLELVLTGANKNGETTFYIFKKMPSPSHLGLFFMPICQLISDGTIRIKKSARSASYQVRQKTGKSFPIIVERMNMESNNSMDLIQEEYDWNYSNNYYELVSSELIPANIVEENQLKALFYNDDLDVFTSFLSGPWYNKKDINNMIVFIPENEKLIFYTQDVQEIYIWDYLKKTVYNNLMFIVQNPTNGSFRKKLNLTIKSIDSISINLGDINWDGTYMKVNDAFMESIFQKNKSSVQPAEIHLTGYYEDENEEVKIIFEPPRFTMIENNNIIEGGFSIIKNIPVLNAFYLKRRLWKIPLQFSKEQFENEILVKVATASDKKSLKDFYQLNKEKSNYILQNQELSDQDKSIIWNILLSIQYKGFRNYQICVLTFNILNENELISKIENYILEFAEIEETNKIIRSIVITEGELSVRGIEPMSDNALTLIQTEYTDH